MFRTQILKSAATLQAVHIAPKQVRLTVNTSSIMSYMSLYAKKVPAVFQWGILLSSVLLHPYAIQGFVKTTHLGGFTSV